MRSMYGLSSKILAVMLAGMMAWSVGVCPCGKAECAMAAQPARDDPNPKTCCHKSATQSHKPTDGSHSNSQHRCANCLAASTANRPSSGGHEITFNFMPAILPLAAMPVIPPSIAAALLMPAEDVPIPPLLQDLFHSSCLLTV